MTFIGLVPALQKWLRYTRPVSFGVYGTCFLCVVQDLVSLRYQLSSSLSLPSKSEAEQPIALNKQAKKSWDWFLLRFWPAFNMRVILGTRDFLTTHINSVKTSLLEHLLSLFSFLDFSTNFKTCWSKGFSFLRLPHKASIFLLKPPLN